MTILLDDITNDIRAYGDQREAEGVHSLDETVAALRKQLAIADPFEQLETVDLTRDTGWSWGAGHRPDVDSSYNRKEQTSFGPKGMTTKVEYATIKGKKEIASSDALGKQIVLPNYFAIEADIQLGGYFGSGCFPAFWARPMFAGADQLVALGELDFWEFMGGRMNSTKADDKALQWKTTVISTPYESWHGWEKPLVFPGPLDKHRWRYEKRPLRMNLYCDGTLLAYITKAEWEAKTKTAGLGIWDRNFEVATQRWYPRLTYQFGPPITKGKYNAAGAVPTSFGTTAQPSSTMTCDRMVTYAMREAA